MFADDNGDYLPPSPSAASATSSSSGFGGSSAGSPYGLYNGQDYGYNSNSTTELVYYLTTYLGYGTPDGTTRVAPVMLCPGFTMNIAGASPTNTVVYYLDGMSSDDGTISLSYFPFGYPTAVSGYTTAQLQPCRISKIQSSGAPFTNLVSFGCGSCGGG